MSDELQFAPLMGFEFVREGEDTPYLTLAIEEKHRQGNGVVHGSVIHAMLDTMMGMQCFRANGRKPCATAEISLRYLEPVFDGRLEARARVIKLGKRLCTLEGTVSRDGVPVAVGQATFVTL